MALAKIRNRGTAVSSVILLCVAGFFSFQACGPVPYVSVSTSAELNYQLLNGATKIYLEPGAPDQEPAEGHFYEVDNTNPINRTTSLMIHGGDAPHTVLIPKHDNLPIFTIESAGTVNFAGVKFHTTTEEGRAILTTNSADITLEIQECWVTESVLEFRGPGDYRIQNTYLHPRGQVDSPLIVENPNARVVYFGGDITNGRTYAPVDTDDFYHHVWLKEGRLKIFSVTVEAALGTADFRIDAASPVGPHVIADVRSEGSNGQGTHPPRILTVPSTSEAVDVLLVSNAGGWQNAASANGPGSMIDYNAAGTVWALGNHARWGATSIVTGSAQAGATVVAVGNFIEGGNILPVTGATEIFAQNIGRFVGQTPKHQFINPGLYLGSYPSVPAFPDVPIPPMILRPDLQSTNVVDGMINVKDAPYGAVGNGSVDGRTGADDTTALQDALDYSCSEPWATGAVVYIPAGTYRITSALQYNTDAQLPCSHASGGWIVGAGRDSTVIVRDFDDPGSVFETDGMQSVTFQDLTFRTAPYDPLDPTPIDVPNVRIDTIPTVDPDPPRSASQQDVFMNVGFDGGKFGLGLGLFSTAQDSNMAFLQTEFQHADVGFGVGSSGNAVGNVVYSSDFHDNQVAMGHTFGTVATSQCKDQYNVPKYCDAGTWTTYGVTTSSAEVDMRLHGSTASSTWLFRGFNTTSSKIITPWNTGTYFPIVFDRSALQATGTPSGQYAIQFHAGGGPILLHSYMIPVSVKLATPQSEASNYAISLHSVHANPPNPGTWSSDVATEAGHRSQVDELP